ncbi:hypothetical protein P154DRAFT_551166 [Amniculicola lignicola CBS 123094]|uniref:Thioredoxin domain-containing protein n=1 Tax=Amniculicola lignicola CBS 123094 TaxID=1392246 RepID=A0A6A5WVL5_9PLEO|nr:hypothetical protein P154DRAFT_551166 [Amniculicola lignicola CBS 123094]
MTWQTELQSWRFPTNITTSGPPAVGQKAPETSKLGGLGKDGKPVVVTFLRHCGCPFAEKTFKSMRDTAPTHPDIRFIAVSHSDQEATNRWLEALGGPADVEVVIDPERESYAAWGLGVTSFWHVLNPWSLYAVYTLGKQDNIWNRDTESGTRWQSSGSFAVGGDGTVKWGGASGSADYVPGFEEAVGEVERKG